MSFSLIANPPNDCNFSLRAPRPHCKGRHFHSRRSTLRVGQMPAAPADDEALLGFITVPVDGDAGVGASGAEGDVVLAQDRSALVLEGVFVAELPLGSGGDELGVIEALGLEGGVPAGADAARLLPAARQFVEGLEQGVDAIGP